LPVVFAFPANLKSIFSVYQEIAFFGIFHFK
jgi:hypothetical protein